MCALFVMAALSSRCGHYILQLWLLSFFPRLFSAVGNWMSTILPYMMFRLRDQRIKVARCSVDFPVEWPTGTARISHSAAATRFNCMSHKW